MVNNVIYRQGIHIGEVSAEDDSTYLMECFVKQDFLQQLLDMNSSKSIILGRTGSGKTALLRFIEETRDDVIRIDPKEVAFSFLANSNIIRFLLNIGCDLNLLFQILWKHVFLKQSILKYFKDRTSFQSAIDMVLDRNNIARKYLEKYEHIFWKEEDIVLEEVSEQFVDAISSDIAGSIGHEKLAELKASASTSSSITNSEKAQIQSRVKKAVSEFQVRDMAHAIEALNDLMDNRQKHFYIILDDLDLDWTENELRYRLIQALVETARSFRKLRNIKLIVALRSDVYEKAISTISAEGVQPEKYDGIAVTIRWRKEALRELVEKRFVALFKYEYSGRKIVGLYEVLPLTIRKRPGFEYICDRTLMRPRDLISFVNMILDKAAGTTAVTQKTVADVEAEYSITRLDALKNEWRSVHPGIDLYISLLARLSGKTNVVDWIDKDKFEGVCLELTDLGEGHGYKDECYEKARQYIQRETEQKLFEVAASILCVLYKVGAIELKLSKQDTFYASYRNVAVVHATQITRDAAFKVSPMLWRALGVTPNI